MKNKKHWVELLPDYAIGCFRHQVNDNLVILSRIEDMKQRIAEYEAELITAETELTESVIRAGWTREECELAKSGEK